jgi:hypothetical protein
MRVAIDAELQAAWENTPVAGNFAEKAGTVHVVVLLTIISMFVLIIIRLKANANKYYER